MKTIRLLLPLQVGQCRIDVQSTVQAVDNKDHPSKAVCCLIFRGLDDPDFSGSPGGYGILLVFDILLCDTLHCLGQFKSEHLPCPSLRSYC